MEEYNLGVDQKNKGKTLAIWFAVGAVAFLVISIVVYVVVVSNDDKIESKLTYLTYSNFSKIEEGMTYDEVVKIFEGHEGKIDTSSSVGDFSFELYIWENDLGTRYVSVAFENGKVYSKSQFGLR